MAKGKAIKLNKGDRFNRLTIVKYNFTDKWGSRHWDCKCDCGKKVIVSAANLRGKYATKSCGCLKKESSSKTALSILQSPENRAKSGLRRRKPGAAFREVFHHYKISARRRGLVFLLTADEFRHLTSLSCFYCGATPNRVYETTNSVEKFIYNGVDRKDNRVGYIMSNSLPCCWVCNKIKGILDYQDFLTHIQRIATTCPDLKKPLMS